MTHRFPFKNQEDREKAKILANAQLQVELAKTPEEFCPLLRSVCKNNCVCYNNAYFLTGNNEFQVNGGYCGNTMFSRECST